MQERTTPREMKDRSNTLSFFPRTIIHCSIIVRRTISIATIWYSHIGWGIFQEENKSYRLSIDVECQYPVLTSASNGVDWARVVHDSLHYVHFPPEENKTNTISIDSIRSTYKDIIEQNFSFHRLNIRFSFGDNIQFRCHSNSMKFLFDLDRRYSFPLTIISFDSTWFIVSPSICIAWEYVWMNFSISLIRSNSIVCIWSQPLREKQTNHDRRGGSTIVLTRHISASHVCRANSTSLVASWYFFSVLSSSCSAFRNDISIYWKGRKSERQWTVREEKFSNSIRESIEAASKNKSEVLRRRSAWEWEPQMTREKGTNDGRLIGYSLC